MRLWLFYCGLGLATLLCVAKSRAQSPNTYSFRVYFTDKQATNYSLSQAQDFLSQAALQRRFRMGLAIDSSDLPVCQPYIDSVLQRTGGQLQALSKWQNTLVVGVTDSFSLTNLQNLPFVKKYQLVAIHSSTPLPSTKPNQFETFERPLADDSTLYGWGWATIKLCKGEVLHQNGFEGSGITIALLDAGFKGLDTNPFFQTLIQEGRIVDRWNFVSRSHSSPDEGAHGTMVLSIISAKDSGLLVGTAPKAKVALYNTEDLYSEQPIEADFWLNAAERADSIGAHIITSSLGYNTFDSPFTDYQYQDLDGKSTYFAQAANLTVSKGIFVTISAGNEGATGWHYLLSPGDADSALTVGAVDSNNSPAIFSSSGPNAAQKMKPDVVAMGAQTPVVNGEGEIQLANGTSFSTPVIAGLAACLLQYDSSLTPYRLKQLLHQISDHFTNPNYQVGYGLPDFSLALGPLKLKKEQQTFLTKPIAIVYPNPNNTSSLHFLIKEQQNSYFSIEIYDVLGRLQRQGRLLSEGQGRYLFPLKEKKQLKGLYFYLIKGAPQGLIKGQFTLN